MTLLALRLLFEIQGLLSLYLAENILFNFRSRPELYGNNWQESLLTYLYQSMQGSYKKTCKAKTDRQLIYHRQAFYDYKTQFKLVTKEVLDK